MKPRTKQEKEVAQLSAALSEDIAVKDAEWARHFFDSPVEGNQILYFSLSEKAQQYNVRRLYRIHKFTRAKRDYYVIYEIMRRFDDGNKKFIFSKQRTMGGYYDCFSYASSLELRCDSANYCGYRLSGLFDMEQDCRPRSRGQRVPTGLVSPVELKRMFKYPYCETLYNQNEQELLMRLSYREYRLPQLIAALKIARRHGFQFNDHTTPLWFDMVNAIINCNYDYHNPKFVAPENFMETHNRFIRMWERRLEQIRIAERMRAADEIMEREKHLEQLYQEKRSQFFPMTFTDGLIHVHVLPDVEAFRSEADYMHHCVYSCGYWNMENHPDSLIMSATIDGCRIETIEVNLSQYRIAQCYGKHDQFTPYHQRILDLVNANMDVIQMYNQPKMKIAV